MKYYHHIYGISYLYIIRYWHGIMAREQWSSNMGFILAAVGSAIGLGNIWRFPYVVYNNGGGAFLIPYFIALFCVGVSVILLELVLGHSTRGSAPFAFRKMSEKYEWIGWLAVISGFTITTYYMSVIGWCLYYLINLILYGFPTDFTGYFFDDILRSSAGPENIGSFSMGILASVAVLWLVNYVIIRSGVKNGLEKANKLLMPLLFVLTLILVLRGITLPGAMEGINWYLTPDFSILLNAQVWIAAFSQIFFSLSLGYGIMIAYASYLPKKSDLTTNAFAISLLNCGYSFLVGFAVFSTLGYMTYSTGAPLNEIVRDGIILAFVVFPKALSLMPIGGFELAVVFFVALVIAGVSSSVSIIEAINAAVMDKFGISRKKAILPIVILGFFGSLLYTTNAGIHWINMVDYFTSGYLLPIVGIAEIVVAIWIFNGNKFIDYLNNLSDIKIGKYWKISVGIITPLLLLGIICSGVMALYNAPYGGYSWKYLGIVATMSVFSVLLSLVISKIKDERECKKQKPKKVIK